MAGGKISPTPGADRAQEKGNRKYWVLDLYVRLRLGSFSLMTPEVENALRSVARECRKAILAGIDGKPKAQHDAIITALLDQHAKRITSLPPGKFSAKLWLVYYVRLIDREVKGEI